MRGEVALVARLPRMVFPYSNGVLAVAFSPILIAANDAFPLSSVKRTAVHMMWLPSTYCRLWAFTR